MYFLVVSTKYYNNSEMQVCYENKLQEDITTKILQTKKNISSNQQKHQRTVNNQFSSVGSHPRRVFPPANVLPRVILMDAFNREQTVAPTGFHDRDTHGFVDGHSVEKPGYLQRQVPLHYALYACVLVSLEDAVEREWHDFGRSLKTNE